MFRISSNVLTELWAELRQRARHEQAGLVSTHNVGDLLSTTLGLGAMEGRQCVFAYDVTFRNKVTAKGLVRPVHTTRFPQHGGAGYLSCHVGATSRVAVVATAGQAVQDAAAQSNFPHSLLLGGSGPDA